jgi:hypothetical protein
VDEGASLLGEANSFGLVGLLFTIWSCRQKMFFFYMLSLKNTSPHAHTKSEIGHLPYVVGNFCNMSLKTRVTQYAIENPWFVIIDLWFKNSCNTKLEHELGVDGNVTCLSTCHTPTHIYIERKLGNLNTS